MACDDKREVHIVVPLILRPPRRCRSSLLSFSRWHCSNPWQLAVAPFLTGFFSSSSVALYRRVSSRWIIREKFVRVYYYSINLSFSNSPALQNFRTRITIEIGKNFVIFVLTTPPPALWSKRLFPGVRHASSNSRM